MKIKVEFFLFILLIVTFSCNYGCIQTHLTNEERKWFSVYEKGDRIIFKSNLGNLDTLIVTNVTNDFTNKDCNRMVGKFQQEFISVKFQPKSRDTMKLYSGGEIDIYKSNQDQYAYPSFKIFGLDYDDVEQQHNFISEKIKLLSNDKSYFVYSFKENVNAANYGNGYLTSYYWNMDNGLIRYILRKGEIFDFVKKTK